MNAITSITITPTVAQANATVTVNGTLVTSGSPSGPVSLTVGPNTITVVVTAQDGVAVRSYTVAVTRLPGLPTATTLAATAILGTGATLNASINPGGYADAFFQLGLTTNLSATVSTLAGSGTDGFTNGTGAAAQFYNPLGVAVDSGGNVYVADCYNNRIRKITPAGVVTTLAGSGAFAYTNGTGTNAAFFFPYDVAVDASGNVYVGDSRNYRIRTVSSAGVVTTLAGSGTQGFADGAGATAKFYSTFGVAVDSGGIVYVADAQNTRVRKVTTLGEVSTLAGSSTSGYFDSTTGGLARFNVVNSVAVDASGNVYVADEGNHCIRKVTAEGVVTTLAGSTTSGYVDGTGAAARFYNPKGVALDASGNLYVVDSLNYRIRKVSPTGVVTTLAGNGTQSFADGPGATAMFNGMKGVAVDGSGNVYVGDFGNSRIRKITPATLPLLLAQSGLTGSSAVPVSLIVTGLLPETTYYYRSVTTNGAGTAYGDFLSFTTLGTNAILSGLALS
ncbi:MAG: cadherin-like beta sandwich domain-containing protein, partial [Verrucomicrobiota bacterium]